MFNTIVQIFLPIIAFVSSGINGGFTIPQLPYSHQLDWSQADYNEEVFTLDEMKQYHDNLVNAYYADPYSFNKLNDLMVFAKQHNMIDDATIVFIYWSFFNYDGELMDNWFYSACEPVPLLTNHFECVWDTVYEDGSTSTGEWDNNPENGLYDYRSYIYLDLTQYWSTQ